MQIINLLENHIVGDEHIITKAKKALADGFDIEKENAGVDEYRADVDVLTELFNKADSKKDLRSAVIYYLHRKKTVEVMNLAKRGEGDVN